MPGAGVLPCVGKTVETTEHGTPVARFIPDDAALAGLYPLVAAPPAAQRSGAAVRPSI
jgi:antitoxin (DNA-binding transcriptional repressor) of toxin-antitoxin stability system